MNSIKAAFTGKAAIATWIGVLLAIAIAVRIFQTRNDPFPWQNKAAPAVTK